MTSSLVPKHLQAQRLPPVDVTKNKHHHSISYNAQDDKLEKYKQLQQLELNGQLTKSELNMMMELERGLGEEKDVIIQFGLSEDSNTITDTISRKSFQGDDDDDDDDDDHPVSRMQNACSAFFSKYGKLFVRILTGLFFIGFTIYLGFAVSYDVSMATALLVLTGLVILCLIYMVIRDTFGGAIYERCLKPMGDIWDKYYHITKWFLYPALVVGVILFLVLEVLEESQQLQSLSGIILFIGLTYFTSKYPGKIRWRPVIWGYSLQFVFAVLVLRWQPGYEAVKWLSEVITKFVNFAYDGAAVTFGDPWMIFHAFAFMGSALIIYIGMLMAILYYYGVTQIAAVKLGWLFQVTMGTTAIETLGVASNIFLNGMDTMLMLRAYLPRLTRSEFHCFLVGGHATVAGFAFALFVLFGAPPEHVLSAAVMSAPATIAICKLNVPETQESCTHKVDDIMMAQGDETNVFEAGANGASIAGKTAAVVIVNYIAFIALLCFVDSALDYIGTRVGYDGLSLALICSYVFWPLALIMGVEVEYCKPVAKLIGLKIICSEILAFQVLGQDVREGLLNERSTAIATYSICGFSSLSTLAIAVGVWNAICPSRVTEMTGQMLRVIVNANMACFMTACIAGLMYTPPDEPPEESVFTAVISAILGAIPSYKDLMALVPAYNYD